MSCSSTSEKKVTATQRATSAIQPRRLEIRTKVSAKTRVGSNSAHRQAPWAFANFQIHVSILQSGARLTVIYPKRFIQNFETVHTSRPSISACPAELVISPSIHSGHRKTPRTPSQRISRAPSVTSTRTSPQSWLLAKPRTARCGEYSITCARAPSTLPHSRTILSATPEHRTRSLISTNDQHSRTKC